MQRVILQLQDSPNYKEQLRAVCREARISLEVLSGLTLCKMRLFWERALRHYEANPTKAETTWFQNELRLFHWTLLTLSCLHNAPLLRLPPHSWKTITDIFYPKSPQMLRFEARKLVSSSPNEQHRPWSPQEGQLLQTLMAERKCVSSWNEISRGLFQSSGGTLYRSGKQCREHWFNHLDPNKNRGEWTPQEDRVLLRFVGEHGHRWAQLCRQALSHRTEHMIKNRFKSLLLRHPQYQQLSERKIIRRLLKEEFKEGLEEEPKEEPKEEPQRRQGNREGGFKIFHLRTYHTEQGEASNAQGASLLDHFPAPLPNSIQIINNSEGGRQNYSQVEVVEEAPILPEERQEGVHRSLGDQGIDIHPPGTAWQRPHNQLQPPQTYSISVVPSDYYLLYPPGMLWCVFWPGGCGQG